MTSTPSPGSHPHTDLLDTLDVADRWLTGSTGANTAELIRKLHDGLRSQIAATDKAEREMEALAHGPDDDLLETIDDWSDAADTGHELVGRELMYEVHRRWRAVLAERDDLTDEVEKAWPDVVRAAEADRDRAVSALRGVVADRDRLAARVETLEGVVRRTIDGIWKYGERTDGSRAWRRDSYYPPVWEPVTPAEAAAIRAALVSPDTPTSPTDTGDPT